MAPETFWFDRPEGIEHQAATRMDARCPLICVGKYRQKYRHFPIRLFFAMLNDVPI